MLNKIISNAAVVLIVVSLAHLTSHEVDIDDYNIRHEEATIDEARTLVNKAKEHAISYHKENDKLIELSEKLGKADSLDGLNVLKDEANKDFYYHSNDEVKKDINEKIKIEEEKEAKRIQEQKRKEEERQKRNASNSNTNSSTNKTNQAPSKNTQSRGVGANKLCISGICKSYLNSTIKGDARAVQRIIDKGNIVGSVTNFDGNDVETTYFFGHNPGVFNYMAKNIGYGKIITVSDSSGKEFKYKVVASGTVIASEYHDIFVMDNGMRATDIFYYGTEEESITLQFCINGGKTFSIWYAKPAK